MAEQLKLLLSGPGLIGHKHAQLIKDLPDAELVAVVAPESSENIEFARQYNVKLYVDINKALDREHVDGVIISSPNEYHYAQALSCIERHIPVLVEKPITENIKQSLQLYKRAKQLNVPVLVGHHRTYNPLLETVKTFMESDKFGELVTFSGSVLFYKPNQYFIDGPWRTKKGGGPILINLIHEIGLVRYLCGEIKEVFAIASNRIRGYEVEDTAAITLVFKNGALGNFILSDTAASNQSWELTTGENPDYPKYDDANCYHFAGTNGSIDFPTMSARYYPLGSERSWWSSFKYEKLQRIEGPSLKLQMLHFLDVIKNGRDPRVSAMDGHMNLVVVSAILKSIETKTIVNVDEDAL